MEYISYGMNLVDCGNSDGYNSRRIIKIKGKMIVNPEWLKSKEKPYFHQISMDCLEKLVECIERFNNDEIDADTSYKISKQILTDEIQDTELLNFAIENYTELFLYIKDGIINIRICRDITGEIWFGVG